jgi:hypothetical protein
LGHYGDPGPHGGGPLRAQHPQGFHSTVPGFRDHAGPAGQHRFGGLIGIERIGFSLQPACLPVRAHHFHHVDALAGEHAREFGAVTAGSFHARGEDGTETGDEVDDPLIAGSRGREFPVRQMLAGVGDESDVVGIGVGIDSGDDFQIFLCHDETALTFESDEKRARRPGGQTRQ